MKTLWEKLDEWKTALGMVAFLAYIVIDEAVVGIWHANVPGEIPETLKWVATVLGGVGLSHKVIKARRENGKP